jgi:hypothetical protein
MPAMRLAEESVSSAASLESVQLGHRRTMAAKWRLAVMAKIIEMGDNEKRRRWA